MAARNVIPPDFFAPGDYAPVSGIYTVIHDGHRSQHLASAVKGDEFPVCRKCGAKVRFRLKDTTGYLTDDWDLGGPNLRLIK
jgi:hypothetical protein